MAALDLIEQINKNELDPTHLHRKERIGIVAALSGQGWTQNEMAQLLRVTDRTIRKDERTLYDNSAKLVENITIKRVAGNMLRLARTLQAKAIKDRNFELAWRIEREKNDELRKLGYCLSPAVPAGSDGTTPLPATPVKKDADLSELSHGQLLAGLRFRNTQDPPR